MEQPNTTTSILSWSRVSGATRYDVQVDGDSGFVTPDFSTSTVNNRAVPHVNLASGTTYWRVRSVTTSGSTSTWSTGQFDSPPSTRPAAISPEEGADLQQPDQPPVLVWDGTSSATSYTVEVDGDRDFVGASSWTTKATSYVVPDPLGGGDWFWRVTANFGGGLTSRPSEIATFDVLSLEAPGLVSPANSPDEAVEDVVLDWTPVHGAKSYEVEVANNQDFTTLIERRTGILGTSYSPPQGYNNDQYYWRVRAIDLGGTASEWAASPYNFKRHWPDRPWPVFPVQDGFPAVVDDANHDPADYPVKRITTAAPYLQWTPVQHASHYRLQVDTQANFSSPNLEVCRIAGTTYTPGNTVLRTTGTQLSLTPDERCTFSEGRLLYWRVRPMDRPFRGTGFSDGIEGIYSPTQAFVWAPEYYTDLSPTGGETVDTPTFRWTPHVAAERYKVEILKRGATTPFHTASTYATSYTPVNVRLNRADGPFRWRLSAIDARGISSAVVTHDFQVSDNSTSTGTAPLSPLTGTLDDAPTVRAPELSWEPVAGADHYRVTLGNGGTGFVWTPESDESLGKKLFYPAMTETGRRILKPGLYDWYVGAYDAAGNLMDESGPATFRIASYSAVDGQAIALDGTTLDTDSGCAKRLDDPLTTPYEKPYCDDVPATPVLSWDHQPGMSFYAVYVSQDANFTNLTETTRIPATSNTRYAFTFANQRPALPDNQSGVPYYWFIRPCKAVGECGPDPVSAATSLAENAFLKSSPKVDLVSPAGGADPVATNEVTFDWHDYFATNEATPWQTEKSPQSAQWYRIQVDNDEAFAAPYVDDITVDQSTYTAFTKLYPEGTLWWRVAAIDGAGNELNWSERRSFTKRSPTVTGLAPSGTENVDVKVPGTTPFVWKAAPFASEYRLEVYKNNDTTFSNANLVFEKTGLKTAAYAHSVPLPASAQPYVWRVQRYDASRNEGRWSVTGRFYSTGVGPTRVAPDDGVRVATNGGLFTWTFPGTTQEAASAASRVTDYLVEIREDGSTFSRYRQETVATAWAPTSAIGDGSWEWRVTARDANRNSLGSSGWGSFRVDAAGPTVTSYSPISSATRRANATVSFSEPVRWATVSGKTFFIRKMGGRTKLSARVTTSSDGRRAVLNPATGLRRGTYYTVSLTSGIKDRSGNGLAAKTWSFRVR